MGNLKLGDWVEEIPGYSPEIGDTFSRDILGTTYQTVIMPDGKEWMAANLAYTGGGIGVWFGGAGSDNGFGRYYLQAEKDSIAALLTHGWHVPIYAEWSALSVAAGGPVGGTSFSLAGALPNWKYDTGTNTTGFSALASGYRFGTWDGHAFNPSGFANSPELRFWLSDMLGADTRFGHVVESSYAPYGKRLGYGTLNTGGEKVLSIRLVRDAIYTPSSYRSGTHDLLILPSGLAETTESLAQRVNVRLRTFFGEHWLNPELGVPWFRDFLVKSPDLAACRQILYDIIRGVRGVQTVNALTLSLSKGSRILSITFAVNGSDAFTSTIPV